MIKVHYEFSRNGITGARNFSDVEVSEELGEVLAELDRKEYNLNHKETRRHESLSYENDKWETLADKKVNIENDFLKNIDYENLHNAIKQLLPQQQELLKKVFFDVKSKVNIANELGITKQALNNRLNKIFENLKKFLN